MLRLTVGGVVRRTYGKNGAPWMAHARFCSGSRSRFFASQPGDWRTYDKRPPRRGAGDTRAVTDGHDPLCGRAVSHGSCVMITKDTGLIILSSSGRSAIALSIRNVHPGKEYYESYLK